MVQKVCDHVNHSTLMKEWLRVHCASCNFMIVYPKTRTVPSLNSQNLPIGNGINGNYGSQILRHDHRLRQNVTGMSHGELFMVRLALLA